MDLGPRASATMLAGMSGLGQFHNFDDDVSKESNDLTVDAGYVYIGAFSIQLDKYYRKISSSTILNRH